MHAVILYTAQPTVKQLWQISHVIFVRHVDLDL